MARSRSGDGDPGGPRGAVRPGCVLAILLLAAGVYAGILILGHEFDYRSLQEAASQEVRLAETKTDDEIRQVLLDKVAELELPPGARDIRVQRLPNGSVLVTIAYPDTIRFLGRWEWVQLREISARGPR
jgi:hypothetical protein